MIQTKRCLITWLRASDVEHLVQLQTDEEVYRFLGGPKDEATVREGFAAAVARGFDPPIVGYPSQRDECIYRADFVERAP